MNSRFDTASRMIRAPRGSIFHTFVDPAVLVSWLPPDGMRGRLETFEPRTGGGFVMTLTYLDPRRRSLGKSSDDADVVRGRFVEVVPTERIVQELEFASDDPAYAGTMRMTWTFADAPGGTIVTVRAEDVPLGIDARDHEAGMTLSLAQLAEHVERAAG